MAVQKAGRLQFQDVFEVVGVGGFTVDPAAYSDDESQVVTATVAGAALGDMVIVGPGVDMAEGVFSASVIAADTVEIVIAHVGGDTTNLASSTWRIAVLRLNSAYAVV
jgi:hypothetical protein